MAVMDPAMLRLAGEIAEAVLFAATSEIEYFAAAAAELDRGLARSGRSPNELIRRTVAFSCVHRNGDEARRLPGRRSRVLSQNSAICRPSPRTG